MITSGKPCTTAERSIGEFFLHFHLHFSSFLSSMPRVVAIAIDANIDDEYRPNERSGGAAQVPGLLDVAYFVRLPVCVCVCVRRMVIGFVKDETCAFSAIQ